ncbi:hypothetical protein Krac_9850 [Ktedonobacter racemifer DSM 44963]|uniref:Uncharacterized protein n=2 Tax=Ktedonobacter racemifer TaxID=363277 RepID=D6TE26_KTERA|nr:hypothetical protein Krac_9850 [Ktedonobacter racemifer DSM 44963]
MKKWYDPTFGDCFESNYRHCIILICHFSVSMYCLCQVSVSIKHEQKGVNICEKNNSQQREWGIMTKNDEQQFAGEQQRPLSRRRFLEGTLGAALASAGIYELIDTLVQTPEWVAFAVNQPLPPEQYAIPTPRLIMDDGSGVASSIGTIPVLIPPLHTHVITAAVKVPANAKALQEAQHHLESVIAGLELPLPVSWAWWSPGDFPTSNITSHAWGTRRVSSRRERATQRIYQLI